jgi:hypothetical protein
MASIERYKIIILIVVFLTLTTLIFIEKFRFPVKYIICDSAYSGCFVSAKFQNMRICQNEVERGNWLCDESNPQNIQCHVSLGSTVVSYCKD